MKYILLLSALLIPQFASSQNAFVLSDSQWLSIIDSTSDAALEGSMVGMLMAYEMYDAQDTTDKTLVEKIKLVRWYYPAVGATVCVLLAVPADYFTSVLLNSVEKPKKA